MSALTFNYLATSPAFNKLGNMTDNKKIELIHIGDYKVDKAELVPYRLPNGGIGWRAVPIVEPETEPVTDAERMEKLEDNYRAFGDC